MQQEGYEKAKWQRCINHDDEDGLPQIMANPKKKMEVADLAMNFVDTHGIDELKMCSGLGQTMVKQKTNADDLIQQTLAARQMLYSSSKITEQQNWTWIGDDLDEHRGRR